MNVSSLDRVCRARFPEAQATLVLANVTDTARALERNHLCGPIAGLVQAEFVGGMALLAEDVQEEGERAVLRVEFPEGQIQGVVMECRGDFSIRGYTLRKVLPELDDSDAPCDDLFDRALGRVARYALDIWHGEHHMAFLPGEVSFKDHLTVTDIFEACFDAWGLGDDATESIAQISAASKLGYVECAHALRCRHAFGADATEALGRLNAAFDSGTVQDALDAGADLAALGRLLGLGEPEELEQWPVRFRCDCTADKVVAMLRGLPRAERLAMIAENRPIDIYCHMCGKCYTITPAQLKDLS